MDPAKQNSNKQATSAKEEAESVYQLARDHKAFLVLFAGLLIIASLAAYSYSLKYETTQSALQNAQFTETSAYTQYNNLQSQVVLLQNRVQTLSDGLKVSNATIVSLRQQLLQDQKEFASLERENSHLQNEVYQIESQAGISISNITINNTT